MRAVIFAALVACTPTPVPVQTPQPEPPRKSIVPTIRWVDSVPDAGVVIDAEVVSAAADASQPATWADDPNAPTTSSEPTTTTEPEVEYENGIAIYKLKAPVFCFTEAVTSVCRFDRATCERVRATGWKRPTACTQSNAMVCVRYRKTTTGDNLVWCSKEVSHCQALVAELAGPDFEFGTCEVLRYKR